MRRKVAKGKVEILPFEVIKSLSRMKYYLIAKRDKMFFVLSFSFVTTTKYFR